MAEFIKSIFATAVIIILTSIIGCSGTSKIKPAQPVIAGDKPAMWRLADVDSEIYLFGTFHLLPPESQWQSARFDAAMLNSTTTYLEADTTSAQGLAELQQTVKDYGVNPAGVTLSSLLGKERAEKLAVVAQDFGVEMADLEPLRPWLASLTLISAAFQKYGLDVNSGADIKIEALAASQGDDIQYLESASSQIKMLANLDDLQDFATFDESMDQMADFENEIQIMLTAWATGNAQELDLQMVKSIKDISQQAHEILLIKRNANWTQQIKKLMAGSGNYFIAVGAAHLVGKQSVVDMLQQAGFTVIRVQ